MFLGHTELLEGASTPLPAGSAWPAADTVAAFAFISTNSCVNGPPFCQGFTSFSLG